MHASILRKSRRHRSETGDDRARTIESLWTELQSVEEWTRFGDAKAGAALVVNAAIFAALTQAVFSDPGHQAAVTLVLASLSLLLAAAGALLALLAVVPRFSGDRDSVTYFGKIAKYPDAASYAAKAGPIFLDDKALTEHLLTQIYVGSTVGLRKYRFVSWSIYTLIASMAAAVVPLMLAR